MAIFAVTTAKGPSWESERDIRHQPAWNEHAMFADELVERGVILFGGPIAGNHDDVALLAVSAADEQQLRSIFGDDPWTKNEVLRVKDVRRWTIWLDGRPALDANGRPDTSVVR